MDWSDNNAVLEHTYVSADSVPFVVVVDSAMKYRDLLAAYELPTPKTVHLTAEAADNGDVTVQISVEPPDGTSSEVYAVMDHEFGARFN